MLTGYTHHLIDNDLDFQQFAMVCARAFPALIHMRDDPLGTEPPAHTEVSTYHKNRLDEAHKNFVHLESMDKETRINYGERKRAEQLDVYNNMLKEKIVINEKLQSMKEKVEAWEPPTALHQCLKEFMIEQLNVSHDDTEWVNNRLEELQKLDAITFWQKDKEEAEKDANYHSKEHEKECTRVKRNNEWLNELKKSLGI